MSVSSRRTSASGRRLVRGLMLPSRSASTQRTRLPAVSAGSAASASRGSCRSPTAGLRGSWTPSFASGSQRRSVPGAVALVCAAAAVQAASRSTSTSRMPLPGDEHAGAADRAHQLAGRLLQQADGAAEIAALRGCLGIAPQRAGARDPVFGRARLRRLLRREQAEQHAVRVVAVELVVIFLLLSGKAERTHHRGALAHRANRGLGEEVGLLSERTRLGVSAGVRERLRLRQQLLDLAGGVRTACGALLGADTLLRGE